jgi:sensor c-di-GMP phosphodiesterase-like protein
VPAQQKRLLAAVIGVVLAGAGMAALTYWQRHIVEQVGSEEVDLAARRLIGLAEFRINAALQSLEQLRGAGASSCRGPQLDALREAAFTNPWLKEIDVIGSDGKVRCSSLGSPIGTPRLLSGVSGAGRSSLAVVAIAEKRMVRVQTAAEDGIKLTAFLPAAMFSANLPAQGGALSSHTRMVNRDGTVIAERGAEPAEARDDPPFRATHRSRRFGLAATVTLPRAAIRAQMQHGQTMTIMVGAIAMLLVVASGRLLPRRRRDPISEFERAIAANEFVPFYQPVVDIRTGRLRGAEVLIRWRKPDGTIIVPSAFIPLAESSGLIIPLTRALMRRARDEVADMLAVRPDLKLGFNLAALHFADETIVSDVREIFESSPLRMQQVVLEVTERQPLENLNAARRVIASLQELGCGVAIDDVGTGHGGLSYMLKLGADTIKIDKMFIDGILTEHHSTKIIESLVDLARNMRMDVVAEGVESFEQVMRLRELGILAAQGHVFCPPIPSSSFLQLVEAIEPVTEGLRVIDGDAGDSAAEDERYDEVVLGVAAA